MVAETYSKPRYANPSALPMLSISMPVTNIHTRNPTQSNMPGGAKIRSRRRSDRSIGNAMIGQMNPPSPSAHQIGNPTKRT